MTVWSHVRGISMIGHSWVSYERSVLLRPGHRCLSQLTIEICPPQNQDLGPNSLCNLVTSEKLLVETAQLSARALHTLQNVRQPEYGQSTVGPWWYFSQGDFSVFTSDHPQNGFSKGALFRDVCCPLLDLKPPMTSHSGVISIEYWTLWITSLFCPVFGWVRIHEPIRVYQHKRDWDAEVIFGR